MKLIYSVGLALMTGCSKSATGPSTPPATSKQPRTVTLVNNGYATSPAWQASAYDNARPAYWGTPWVVVLSGGGTACIRFDLADLGGDTVLGFEAVSTAPGANNFQFATANVGTVTGWSWDLVGTHPPVPASPC
jgi:hypothetical protein